MLKTLKALFWKYLNYDDYYQSADTIPCGRYFLGVSKDKRYFINGDINKVLSKKIDHLKLNDALHNINSSLVDNEQKTKENLEIIRLSKIEGQLHMTRSLVSVMAYVTALIESGVDKKTIDQKIMPIASLLRSYGIGTSQKRNMSRLSRAKKQLEEKYKQIEQEVKCSSGDIYKAFIGNLVVIEAELGC